MKRISQEESKKIQVALLKYIDSVCREHDIKYSIAYGTLLGAVRHKGFIPWDDDIDIMLFRDDYERLLKELYKNNENSGRYKVFSPKDQGYFYPYAKLSDTDTVIVEKNWPQLAEMGLFVDIFPIDYIPENKIEKCIKRGKYLDLCIKYCLTDIWFHHPRKIMRFIKRIIRYPKMRINRKKGERYWKQKIDEFLSEVNKPSRKIGLIIENDVVVWDAKVMEEYTSYEFENEKFMGIKDYDYFLSTIYGNYMELPPKNKRISGHDYIAYWR